MEIEFGNVASVMAGRDGTWEVFLIGLRCYRIRRSDLHIAKFLVAKGSTLFSKDRVVTKQLACRGRATIPFFKVTARTTLLR